MYKVLRVYGFDVSQLIQNLSVGFLKRLLGHKDIDERISLAKEIHEILSKDKRFSDLKWFSRYTDKPSDEYLHRTGPPSSFQGLRYTP